MNRLCRAIERAPFTIDGVPYRVDERRRQREHRERHVDATSAETTCSAPASPPKLADMMEKMLESWDSAVAMSRASLQRRFGVILRRSRASVETAMPVGAAMSRASLGP